MKMRLILMLIPVVVFSACIQNKNKQQKDSGSVPKNVFEVSQVIHSSSYSYLNVKEGEEEKWMAVTKQDIQAGDVFYYDEAMQMINFHSKELDRTFEKIYFVNQISKTPIVNHPAAGMNGMGSIKNSDHTGHTGTGKKNNILLDKTAQEFTIAQIYESKADISGKEIEIRGIVVKVNNGIMGKNWIHIQDGTESNGNFDLTITSQELAEVNDEVTFKGKITINKDFGSGYFYELIMEDAILKVKTTAELK